jgi:hypothetical protein
MKMWRMVPRTGFAIHSNNNTEEAAKFGHPRILLSSSSCTQSGFDAAEFSKHAEARDRSTGSRLQR